MLNVDPEEDKKSLFVSFFSFLTYDLLTYEIVSYSHWYCLRGALPLFYFIVYSSFLKVLKE